MLWTAQSSDFCVIITCGKVWPRDDFCLLLFMIPFHQVSSNLLAAAPTHYFDRFPLQQSISDNRHNTFPCRCGSACLSVNIYAYIEASMDLSSTCRPSLIRTRGVMVGSGRKRRRGRMREGLRDLVTPLEVGTQPWEPLWMVCFVYSSNRNHANYSSYYIYITGSF